MAANAVKLSRRSACGLIGAAGAIFSASRPARADKGWKPNNTVNVIVPWPPGGGTDILVRLTLPTVSKRLEQPVVVRNKPGASGSLGSQQVYDSAPDGLNLLGGVSDNALYPQVADARYDPEKFVVIAPLASSPYVLLVRPDLPVNDLKEFLDLARSKTLTYANAGMGASIHVLTTAFGLAAKIDHMQHVPYQGMAPALTALAGGFVDALLVITGGTTSYRGKLKFLAVTSAVRVAALPDVPTMTEAGLPFVGEAWEGILAPPGTPAPIADALFDAFSAATADPEYQARVKDYGMRMLDMNRAKFTEYDIEQNREWGKVAKDAGIHITS